jgi:hypothetical protein
MSTRPFRFIHASDFHLEQPLMGVAEVPDHLRELFLDAPYRAVSRLFEAVEAEDAQFVILSGDLLHSLAAGPRGTLFLLERFRRLAERGIDVYWAGGIADPPDVWPAALALPQNVHVFPQGRVEQLTIQRDGEPLAQLAGTSRDGERPLRPADFAADPAGLYSIAVAHGEIDAAALPTHGIHYWALGGRHDRSTLLGGPQTVHYCGSPQGRRPAENGIHGCTFVEVDAAGQTRTSLIDTDAIRWMSERITVDETTSREELELRLRDRLHALVEAAPAMDLLISWTVAGHGSLLGQLRKGALAAELLGWLRNDFGFASPAAWSVSLGVEMPETLPLEWYDQETIRGDFLRAIRQLQMNADEPLALDPYLAEAHLAGTLAAAAAVVDKPARNRVLREAAALGADLLSGEEPGA